MTWRCRPSASSAAAITTGAWIPPLAPVSRSMSLVVTTPPTYLFPKITFPIPEEPTWTPIRSSTVPEIVPPIVLAAFAAVPPTVLPEELIRIPLPPWMGGPLGGGVAFGILDVVDVRPRSGSRSSWLRGRGHSRST